MGTRENRGQERKSRNNAFKYFAIEEWIKEGSQEKRGGSQECKILIRNVAGDPLFHPYMALRSAILLRRRISNDTLGKERDH